MMSLSAIRAISNERAYQAAEEGHKPLQVWDGDELRQIPFLGYEIPSAYKLVRVFFADSSGWGRPSEPALTFEQLQDEVVPGRHYALVETGQFQVHIGEYVLAGEEVEVDLSGKGVFGPESIEAEAESAKAYKAEREASEAFWHGAASNLGLEDEVYEAMDDGLGGHILVHSVEEAEQNFRDYGYVEEGA